MAAGERALHRQGETPLRIKPVQRASLAVKHQTQRAGQRWMGAGDRRQRFVEQGDIVTRQLADLYHAQPLQIGFRTNKAAHELACRVGQNTVGGIKLRQHAAFLENGDFIAETDRFIDVVGHQYNGFLQPLLQQQQLVLEAFTDHRVDGGEGLIHQ